MINSMLAYAKKIYFLILLHYYVILFVIFTFVYNFGGCKNDVL